MTRRRSASLARTRGIRSSRVFDPKILSVTVRLLGGHGAYDVVATVRGGGRCELAEPFSAAFRLAGLLA
ncbi:hypothetical protein [Protofrankia symbiont of Coriaria ruscifolia]|uniref:hypothetical protein n=1 Tax=Protofrankia symbiont of Coriaria ruscifolia TaxID=1306542 RepID=UPI0010412572|nr:hypothetical protein [Protofrankia symbiont of Coriaria ruscifolia]